MSCEFGEDVLFFCSDDKWVLGLGGEEEVVGVCKWGWVDSNIKLWFVR